MAPNNVNINSAADGILIIVAVVMVALFVHIVSRDFNQDGEAGRDEDERNW